MKSAILFKKVPVVRYIELKSFLYVVAFPKDMYDKFISKAVQELKQCHLTTLEIISLDFEPIFVKIKL